MADALKQISNKANFYFVYNSHIINRDSLVSVLAVDKPVKKFSTSFSMAASTTSKATTILFPQGGLCNHYRRAAAMNRDT